MENELNDESQTSTEELFEKFDLALRPKIFDDFIGQPQVHKNLSTFIKAASIRDEPMDHILLHGPRD